MTNVPYGMIMMTTNEWLRAALEDGLYGFHEHYPGGNNHHHDEKPFLFIVGVKMSKIINGHFLRLLLPIIHYSSSNNNYNHNVLL
jgi:hypothetical protein